jgi:hypothetical protein
MCSKDTVRYSIPPRHHMGRGMVTCLSALLVTPRHDGILRQDSSMDACSGLTVAELCRCRLIAAEAHKVECTVHQDNVLLQLALDVSTKLVGRC